jgi:phospholipid-binding lipoprotein MlaA
MPNNAFRRILAALLVALAASGCATTTPDPRDPFEPVNRVVFEFNDQVDRFTLKPIAQGYNFVLPQFVRTGVRNFFSNLRDPWIGVNNLLQGKFEWALSDFFRFFTNSTWGLAGLTDIASDMGMEKHNEDFGQTLGRWGLPSGPYLVLPILGPSTVRDGTGLIADGYAYLPWRIPTASKWSHYVAWRNGLLILDSINIRANLLGSADLLEQAALDRYSFVRNAFLQRRLSQVYDGNPPRPKDDGAGMEPAVVSLDAEPARLPPALTFAWVQVPPYQAPQLQIVDPKMPANYDAVLAARSTALARGR